MNKAKAVLALGCAVCFAATAATAEDKVKLRLGSHLASNAPGMVELLDVFKKRAEELSGGSIEIDIYPGEQAGKALQMWDLVKVGAVDIGDLASGYISSDKVPLIGVMELPGISADLCAFTEEMNALTSEGGAIYESELKPQGMRSLAATAYPPYTQAASRVKIENVDDLAGRKVRVAGGLMEHTVSAVGSVPVNMPSPEVYTSLQRGTVDAAMFSFISAKSYDLDSVAKFATTGYNFGAPGNILGISDKKFSALSPEHQKVLVQAGHDAAMHWCKFTSAQEAKDIEALQAAGVEVHQWTPDQVKELDSKVATVAEEWASTLDKRGKPASDMLNALRAKFAQ